jgi:hypothetical protein
MAEDYPHALQQALIDALEKAGIPPGADVNVKNQTFGEATIQIPAKDRDS